MKIVYIPACLYGALKAAQFSAADLKDVSKLMSTLSAEDVAFYLHANSDKHCPIPEQIQATFPNLLEGIDLSSEEYSTVRTKCNSYKYNGNAPDIYEENSILFSDCLEEDLFIITHVAPTDATGDELGADANTAFYDRFLQQMLTLQKLDVVMKSPVLLGWMKSVQATAKSP